VASISLSILDMFTLVCLAFALLALIGAAFILASIDTYERTRKTILLKKAEYLNRKDWRNA
jgi:hypothetical protein